MFAWVSASLVAASLGLAGQAAASEPQAAQVSARGVDLADPAARARLEQRIDRAAAQVCGVDPNAPVDARRQQNLCMIAAGNAARARLKQIEAGREVRMAGL
jgi:UrcA family protein